MLYTNDSLLSLFLAHEDDYLTGFDPSYFFFKVTLSIFPELSLISAIFLYLCFVKNLNNFYISSLFFEGSVSGITGFLASYGFFLFCWKLYTPILFFSSHFTIDFYSVFCKLFLFGFLWLIHTVSLFKLTWDSPVSADIYIPIYFFLLFSLFLLSAFNLFGAYLALEGVSLTLYTLVACAYHKRVAIEAVIKYVVFGGISNGLLLKGNSIIFGLCGTLNYVEVKYLFNILHFNLSSIEVCLGLICFVLVFLFKVAAFPCHMWSPDVYEGAWLPITIILIVLVKLLYFLFFFKVFFYVFIKLIYLWQPLILLSSLGSLIIGSFGIVGQNRIKRFMAYSSINHVSFILLGMSCGSTTGLAVTILYLLVYSFTLLLFFSFALNSQCFITGRALIYLTDFANLSQFTNFTTQGFLLIVLFSMGGLPPLAGFFIKFYIYLEALSSGFYLFVIFSLVISIISTFYYLFFLKSIFFDKNLYSKIISLNFYPTLLSCIFCLFLISFLFVNHYAYDLVLIMSLSLFCPNWFTFVSGTFGSIW